MLHMQADRIKAVGLESLAAYLLKMAVHVLEVYRNYGLSSTLQPLDAFLACKT